MSSLIPFRRNNHFALGLDDFDGIFNNFFHAGTNPLSRTKRKTINTIPPANVNETGGGYEISLAAPGLSRGDFKLSVEDGVLNISAGVEESAEDDYYREFNYSNFKRSWSLPKDTDPESITANYGAGILNITIPTEVKKKRLIDISVD